jgi:hypothetical protein
VGDTRPANEDDTAGYPTSVITTIYTDLAQMTPMPQMVVSTGDYQFAAPAGNEGANQLALYLQARSNYPGVQFPTMGNHECTGATASNCTINTAGGLTNNYNSYVSMLLGPIGQTNPYYSINVAAPDNSWTAKFVFVAANAWSSAQSTWLTATLAQSTTYTFVIRHEPSDVGTSNGGPPGVDGSNPIIAANPCTLVIVGHTHTYDHYPTSGKEIIVGNGGAPLTGSKNYGYGIVAQRADGALVVDMYDYQTNAADPDFHFVIMANGTLTQ